MANSASFVGQNTTVKGKRVGQPGTALTGTTTFAASASLVGVGTKYLTELQPFINQGGCYLANSADSPPVWVRVTAVADDLHCTLATTFTGTTGSHAAVRGVSVFGTDGGDAIGDSGTAYLPAYVTITPTNRNANVGAPSVDPDVDRFEDGNPESISYYANPGSDLKLALAITGGGTHQMSLYFYDVSNRTQTVTLIDGDTLATLDGPRTLSGTLATPVWLSWNCSGNVTVVLHSPSGSYTQYNAIVFDPVAGGGGGSLLRFAGSGGLCDMDGGMCGGLG